MRGLGGSPRPEITRQGLHRAPANACRAGGAAFLAWQAFYWVGLWARQARCRLCALSFSSYPPLTPAVGFFPPRALFVLREPARRAAANGPAYGWGAGFADLISSKDGRARDILRGTGRGDGEREANEPGIPLRSGRPRDDGRGSLHGRAMPRPSHAYPAADFGIRGRAIKQRQMCLTISSAS